MGDCGISELNALFRKRIGMPENEKITFAAKPVPLTGGDCNFAQRAFRARKAYSEHGDYVLEMKLKHKDNEWRLGYVFDSVKPVDDVAELNENQKIIAEHPDSPFNKHSLITLHTEQGRLTPYSASGWTNTGIRRRANSLA